MDWRPEVYTSGETRARHSNARADGVFCVAALQKSGSSGSTFLANSRTQMCVSRFANLLVDSADSIQVRARIKRQQILAAGPADPLTGSAPAPPRSAFLLLGTAGLGGILETCDLSRITLLDAVAV